MTNEQIKLYGEMFKELGLTELKVKGEEGELVLKKEVNVVTTPAPIATPVVAPIANMPVNTSTAPGAVIDNSVSSASEEIVAAPSGTEVKAPLVGVFYSAPSPDAEPFVKVGDKVSKGDVLCVIEAMKMFNEIKADVTGEILEICVDNGNIVEYGQPIFRIAEK